MERLDAEHLEQQSVSILEHQHRYKWASLYSRGIVCDIACGAGYGSKILLENSNVDSYIGMDISSSTLEFAKSHFKNEKTNFLQASAVDIPLENMSVDTIISMETLEHLENPGLAVQEFRRILRPGGILIGSVPSKKFEEKCEACYGPNVYHIQRFTLQKIQEILCQEFPFLRLGISMVGISTLIYPAEGEGDFAGFKSKAWLPRSSSFHDGSIHFVASDNQYRIEELFSEIHCFHGMSYIDYQATEVSPLRKAYKVCEELVATKDLHLQQASYLIEARDAEILSHKRRQESESIVCKLCPIAFISQKGRHLQQASYLIEARDAEILSHKRKQENEPIVSKLSRIAFISQPEYFRFIYEADLDQIAEVREFNLASLVAGKGIEELLDFSADYNFFFRGELINSNLLNKLTGAKIALSSEPFPRKIGKRMEFTKDSLRRYADFRRRVRDLPFDYIYHYDETSLGFMRRDGLHLSGAFAFPVATDTYKEYQLDSKWELFFIGRSTKHREAYFGPLKHQFKFLHVCHGVYGPSLIKYIAQSKICLNVHAEPEVSWEPRMQMMLATGAFVISEKITPNRFLRPGIDYIEASSPIDLKEKVDYYLNHEEERRHVASNGQARVRSLLDSKTNFRRLIQDIDERQALPFKHTTQSLLMDLIGGGFRTLDYLKLAARAFNK